MKLTRLILVLLAALLLVGVAYVNQATEPAAVKMADAADKFLSILSPELKKEASFAFDDKERLNWHFIPLQDKDTKKATRKGVPLEKMSMEQKAAALQLVKAGTSATGYVEATSIMALESILFELEKNGAMVRNPDWYFFSVFGTPSKTGQWGWRVEGHHLSLNFTMDKGQVVATPCFFGANPAIVMSGNKKGQKTLADSQEHAKVLLGALDDEQKKTVMQTKAFPEPAAKATTPGVGAPVGLAGSKMNEKQKSALLTLIEGYANRLPPDIATAELAQVKKDGLDQVYFALSGSTEQGKGYTYRVQGPSFVIEFLNMQADSANNPANHIHSSWRHIQGDFGLTK